MIHQKLPTRAPSDRAASWHRHSFATGKFPQQPPPLPGRGWRQRLHGQQQPHPRPGRGWRQRLHGTQQPHPRPGRGWRQRLLAALSQSATMGERNSNAAISSQLISGLDGRNALGVGPVGGGGMCELWAPPLLPPLLLPPPNFAILRLCLAVAVAAEAEGTTANVAVLGPVF